MNPLLTKLPYLWRPWSWACASPGCLGTFEEFLSMKIRVSEVENTGSFSTFFFGRSNR